MLAFARFLGLEFTTRANITDIVNAVCAAAAHTRLELVCIDEIHNLNLATRTGAYVPDQLKYFAERLPATYRLRRHRSRGPGPVRRRRGRQIARRFTVIPAAPVRLRSRRPARATVWSPMVHSSVRLLTPK